MSIPDQPSAKNGQAVKRLEIPSDTPYFGGNEMFERFKYAAAVEVGPVLYISGQVGVALDGTVPTDPELQFDLAFLRLGEILKLKGLDFGNLVDLVSYHVDIHAHMAKFVEVKDRYLVRDFPCWTTIGVAALARPAFLVELKATAAIRPSTAA